MFYNCKPVIDNWIKIHWYFIQQYFGSTEQFKSVSPLIVSLIEHLNYTSFYTLDIEPCQRDCLLQTVIAKIILQRASTVHEPSEDDHKLEKIVKRNLFCLELAATQQPDVDINVFAHTKDPDYILASFIAKGRLSDYVEIFRAHKHLFDEAKTVEKTAACFNIKIMRIDLHKFMLMLELIKTKEKQINLISQCITDLMEHIKTSEISEDITSLPNFLQAAIYRLLKKLEDCVSTLPNEKQKDLFSLLSTYNACYEFLKALDDSTKNLLVLPKDIENNGALEKILTELLDRDKLA